MKNAMVLSISPYIRHLYMKNKHTCKAVAANCEHTSTCKCKNWITKIWHHMGQIHLLAGLYNFNTRPCKTIHRSYSSQTKALFIVVWLDTHVSRLTWARSWVLSLESTFRDLPPMDPLIKVIPLRFTPTGPLPTDPTTPDRLLQQSLLRLPLIARDCLAFGSSSRGVEGPTA